VIDRSHAPAPTGCPGLFHIVGARDGGLCRIRLPRGELSASQAVALAEGARRHASGIVDITNRANLQLRGVRAGGEDALIAHLLGAGLGPLVATGDADGSAAARDDRRNVMISPTAGIDAQALIDTRPVADRLLHDMQVAPHLDALSPKFAVLIDGGEALAQREHPHDIWLVAVNGTHFALGLAGVPGTPLRMLGHADAAACVLTVIQAFLELAPEGARRMRDLLATVDADTVLERARLHGARFMPMHNPSHVCRETDIALRLGIHPQRDDALHYVGFQPPLGRMDANLLERVATLACDAGNGHLRMTPWQGVILADVPRERATEVFGQLRAWGMLVDPSHELANIVTCAGSSGCAKSPVDTKSDALRLAAHGLPSGTVHLSGCSRSCASAAVAAHTLLAVAPDRYDVYRRDAQPGFGRRIASHVTLQEAAAALRGHGQETY
jgi:precorrin-3B synthase